jgi:hypothetical protein
MDAQTLIGATSHVSSEEDELEQHLDTLRVPPAIRKLVKVLIAHMADEIDISIVHPQIGFQGRIVGEGLSLIVKNVAKFIPSGE